MCALDNNSLLLIAQSQIILSQSTDLQLPILFMQWTAVVWSESIFIWESQIWSQNDLSPKGIALSSKVLMCMRISLILNLPPVEVFLKTAHQSVVDASVLVVNERFSILIVFNDRRILFLYLILSCLTCGSIVISLSKLPLLIFSASVFRRSSSLQWVVHILWIGS